MFKSKVVVPKTSETCLDLIRNADPTGLADFFINGGQIPLWRNDLPTHGGECFGDETSDPVACLTELCDRVIYKICVVLGPFRIIAAEAAAIVICDLDQLNPILRPHTPLGVELIGRDIDHARGVAVIAVVWRYHPLGAGMGPRQSQRQLVRFGS